MESVSNKQKAGRQVLNQILSLMVIFMFSIPLFGCTDKKPAPTDDTTIPSSPEECITKENLVFYNSDAVVATVGGDRYTEFKLYKYTNTELVLVRSDKDPDEEVRTSHRIVPASVLDDCMKLTKKYKMGKGKWLNGSGIVGKVYEVGFMKDGEYIHVSSESMPDNGMDAFDAVAKILGEAWRNADS